MGKIIRKSDRDGTPKPKRKRRKRDLDNIHAKILKAKRKLDNVGKGSNKSVQKGQGRAKISSRLLPRSFAGIYRNGAKGKDIQRERSENIFSKARLEGDALRLFNSDTPESKYMVEDTIHDKSTKQSPSKEFVKNNLEWTPCTVQQSPVLGKRQDQDQKLYFVKKKKNEENLFENLNPNNVRKYNVNNESKYTVQKEDTCKRRLFQNDREQLKNNNNTQIQIFDNIDISKANKSNEKKREAIYSENSKSTSWDPLTRYMELCGRISAENFETGFLHELSCKLDPLKTTIKKLRQIYADSYQQGLLRDKNKRELSNPQSSTLSCEYQACIYSDNSQLSPVEFEVPKCIENDSIATRLEEGISQVNNFHSNLVRNGEFKKNGGITQYGSAPCSSRNMFAAYDTSSVIENHNNKQYNVKQSSNIHQPSKSISFCFVNEKSSVGSDSQKKSNKHNKEYIDNFYIDIPNNSRCLEKKHLGATIFSNSPTLPAERHLLKDYPRESLPTKLFNDFDSTAISDNRAANNTLRKCNDRITNKCNMKDIRRVPTILRRCNNVSINRNNRHAQINSDYTEGLCKKSETSLLNECSNITREFYETEFPNMNRNFPTPDIVNHMISCDRSKILEPQIGSMEIKDSQESEIEKGDINLCINRLNGKNEFRRFDYVLRPQSFESSHNTNAYIEQLTQQQGAPNTSKHFHSNDNRPINYVQSTNFSNVNVEPTKQFSQQTKSRNSSYQRTCEINHTKQELFAEGTRGQCQNIFVKSVKDRTIPMATLNFPQNTRNDKKSGLSTCEGIFSRTDLECVKNHTNQNACGCDRRYIYLDSTNCPHNISQTHHFHEDTRQTMMEPEISYETKGHNSDTDNCVNLLNGVQNVRLLSLEQRHNTHTYPKVIDSHNRAVLLQNISQPIKYLAVKNGPNVQRVPVYANDGNIGIIENVPLKVVALMNANTQTRAFPQAVTAQLIPLQTNGPQLDDNATHKNNNQSSAKHLDSVNMVLFNPSLQSNTWYSSNL